MSSLATTRYQPKITTKLHILMTMHTKAKEKIHKQNANWANLAHYAN